jgi:hypothetical protein
MGISKASIVIYANGELRIRSAPCSGSRRAASRCSLDKQSEIQESAPSVGKHDIGAICERSAALKPGWGGIAKATKFRKEAKQTIKEYGAVADEVFGSNQLFLTWTLPGDGAAPIEALARWSSYVSHRVCQWLRDTIDGAWIAWVFEFQKRGALHQHLIVGGHHRGQLLRAQAEWCDTMRAIFLETGRKAGVYLLGNEQTQHDNALQMHLGQKAEFVVKSAARYLCKYVSKNSGGDGVAAHAPPVRWWRVNTRALQEIRSRRRRLDLASRDGGAIQLAIKIAAHWWKQQAVSVKWYANSRFAWLSNYSVWTESAEVARRQWDQMLQECAPITSVGYREYPLRLEQASPVVAGSIQAAAAPSIYDAATLLEGQVVYWAECSNHPRSRRRKGRQPSPL